MLSNKIDSLLTDIAKLSASYRNSDNPFNSSMYAGYSRYLCNSLNAIFTDAVCVDVLLTDNTDKQFFGVYVSPTILGSQLPDIMFGNDPVILTRYQVEIDMRMFNILDNNEIVAILLHEISSLIGVETPIYNLRGLLDTYQAETNTDFSLTLTVSNSQLLIFAIKDTLNKLTSCFYAENDVLNSGNKFMEINDLTRSLGTALRKVLSNSFGLNDTVRSPKVIILQWALRIYSDVDLNRRNATQALEEAKTVTGSKLIQKEIDKTIESLDRINSDEVTMESVIVEGKKGGFFTNLKRDGLRSIEDDLYEFKVRVKTSDTEDEAMYTLRQINTRINIIEEYLYNNECTIDPREVERWRNVAIKYRELREELTKKAMVKQKSYGLFFDYDNM